MSHKSENNAINGNGMKRNDRKIGIDSTYDVKCTE